MLANLVSGAISLRDLKVATWLWRLFLSGHQSYGTYTLSSFNLNHIPRGSISNIVTLWVRASTYAWEAGHKSVCNTVQSFCLYLTFLSPTVVRQAHWLVLAHNVVTVRFKYKRTKTEFSSSLFLWHSDWGDFVPQIVAYMIAELWETADHSPRPSCMRHVIWFKK